MSMYQLTSIILCVAIWALATASVQADPYIIGPEGPLPTVDRTICGENDMVAMIDQSEALKQIGMPIGRLRAARDDEYASLCTGTLIEKDLYVTARHCKSTCENMTVTFGYLEDGDGEGEETFDCKDIIETGGSGTNQDYMVIRLEGNPGINWGWYSLSDMELEADRPLLMIHHPRGTPMKVSMKNCVFKKIEGGMLRHRCDTEPGSSGSAIIVPNYEKPEESRIVGVHAFGGCYSTGDSTNSGPAVKHLVSISPYIQSLVK